MTVTFDSKDKRIVKITDADENEVDVLNYNSHELSDNDGNVYTKECRDAESFGYATCENNQVIYWIDNDGQLNRIVK